MRYRNTISCLIGLLGWAGLAQAQQQPDSTARHILLPEVQVRPELPQVLSTYHGKFAKGVRPLTPGQRCVIWLASPDTSQVYQLNSLTIPLHRRYSAGRLRVSFYAQGRAGELLGTPLSAHTLVISPPDSIAKRRTQLRISLRANALRMAGEGVYVVLDGLSTYDDEVFVRYKSVPRRHKKDGTTIVRPYILTRRPTDTTTIWTPIDEFPKLRQSVAGYVANTWMRWFPEAPYRREGVQAFRGRVADASDTVVLLEVQRQ